MRRIFILGLGKSGYWATILAMKKGYKNIVVCDEDKDNQHVLKKVSELKKYGVLCLLGGDIYQIIPEKKDLVIVSPGINLKRFFISNFLRNKPEVISEIEFASRFAKGSFIGVTGTNGKTTVCMMINHILKKNGIDCTVVGNVGYPFSRFVVENDGYKLVIVELSSFQLEKTNNVFLNIGLLLNITQDHIDRHGSFENYIEAKKKIANLISKNGFLVVDKSAFEQIGKLDLFVEVITEKGFMSDNSNIFINDRDVVVEKNNGKFIFSFLDYNFLGRHNFRNAVFSAIACEKLGINVENSLSVLKDFNLPEHRLEVFWKRDGVVFVNDSKSTTPDSLISAVSSFDKDIYLIAGGIGKKTDFSILNCLKDSKIKKVYLIGKSKYLMASVLKKYFDVYMFDSLDGAIEKALFDSKKGGVVLFSPGCASYDMFSNYEERGNMFKREVLKRLAA